MFKIKYKDDGTFDKYKICIVSKEYAQEEGINYEEKFSPTPKIKIIIIDFVMAT